MTWVVPAGSRIDGELRIVDLDASTTSEVTINPHTVTYRLLDRTGALVTGQTGDGEYEAEGTYNIRPTMPSSATKGHTYLLEVTVTVTPGGATHLLLIPILVGGPTL